MSLVVCYLIVKKGVKTSGKIVTITSVAPYFFFTILALRACFLDGAMNGVKYLLIPDFSKLLSV